MKHRNGLLSVAGLLTLTLGGCTTYSDDGSQASTNTSPTNTATPTQRTGRLMVASDRLGGVIYRQPATPVGPATAAVKTD